MWERECVHTLMRYTQGHQNGNKNKICHTMKLEEMLLLSVCTCVCMLMYAQGKEQNRIKKTLH